MFDIGFWELLILAALGLMILGPERLPRVIGQLGRWLRKARRTASQLRWQIEHELDLTERREAEQKRRQAAPPAEQQKPANADGSSASHGDAYAAAAHGVADHAHHAHHADPAPAAAPADPPAVAQDIAPDTGADSGADSGQPVAESGAEDPAAPARMPDRESAMMDEDRDRKTSTRQ
jgi:Tat protein translocase TatB subunit